MLSILIETLSERHATIPYLLKVWSVFVGGASREVGLPSRLRIFRHCRKDNRMPMRAYDYCGDRLCLDEMRG